MFYTLIRSQIFKGNNPLKLSRLILLAKLLEHISQIKKSEAFQRNENGRRMKCQEELHAFGKSVLCELLSF